MAVARKLRAILANVAVGESQTPRHHKVGPNDRPTGIRHNHKTVRMYGGW